MLAVKSKVNVVWQESDCKFSGTVIALHKNGEAVDICYDELVDGKECVELNVPLSRLELRTDLDGSGVRDVLYDGAAADDTGDYWNNASLIDFDFGADDDEENAYFDINDAVNTSATYSSSTSAAAAAAASSAAASAANRALAGGAGVCSNNRNNGVIEADPEGSATALLKMGNRLQNNTLSELLNVDTNLDIIPDVLELSRAQLIDLNVKLTQTKIKEMACNETGVSRLNLIFTSLTDTLEKSPSLSSSSSSSSSAINGKVNGKVGESVDGKSDTHGNNDDDEEEEECLNEEKDEKDKVKERLDTAVESGCLIDASINYIESHAQYNKWLLNLTRFSIRSSATSNKSGDAMNSTGTDPYTTENSSGGGSSSSGSNNRRQDQEDGIVVRYNASLAVCCVLIKLYTCALTQTETKQQQQQPQHSSSSGTFGSSSSTSMVATETGEGNEENDGGDGSENGNNVFSCSLAEETLEKAVKMVLAYVTNCMLNVGNIAAASDPIQQQQQQQRSSAGHTATATTSSTNGNIDATAPAPASLTNTTARFRPKTKNERYLMKAAYDIANSVLPHVLFLMGAVRSLLCVAKQSDRLAVGVAELCFVLLNTDCGVHAVCDYINRQTSGQLSKLHMLAVDILQLIFAQYARQRHFLLVEILTLMCTSFSVKNVSQPYALHYSSNYRTEGVTKYISIPTLLLLICTQGTIHIDVAALCKHSSSSSALLSAGGSAAAAGKKTALLKTNNNNNKSTTTKKASSNNGSNKSKSKKVAAGARKSSSSNSDTNMDLAQHIVKTSTSDIHAFCNMFVTELFKRCMNRESGAEYRQMTHHFLSELLSATQSPSFVVSCIFTEVLSKHVMGQLVSKLSEETTTAAGGGNGTGTGTANGTGTSATGGKKDFSFTTFLLDLLGAVLVGVRRITLSDEVNAQFSDTNVQLPPHALTRLRNVVHKIALQTHLPPRQQLRAVAAGTAGTGTGTGTGAAGAGAVSAKETKKRGKKALEGGSSSSSTRKQKKQKLDDVDNNNNEDEALYFLESEEEDENENESNDEEDGHGQGEREGSMCSIATALQFLTDLASNTMDVVSEPPQWSEEAAGSATAAQDLLSQVGPVAPSPWAVLAQLGGAECDALLNCVSTASTGLTLQDLHFSLLCDYLLQQYTSNLLLQQQQQTQQQQQQQASSSSSSSSYFGSSSAIYPRSAIVGNMQTAYEMMLCLWLSDLTNRINQHSRQYPPRTAADAASSSGDYSNTARICDYVSQLLERFKASVTSGTGTTGTSGTTASSTTTLIGSSSSSSSSTHSTFAHAQSQYRIKISTEEYSRRILHSTESILSINRSMTVHRTLSAIFDHVLRMILNIMSNSMPTIRSKALKLLSIATKLDPPLFLRPLVRESITSRLLDRAISVREETAKLVGNFIVNNEMSTKEGGNNNNNNNDNSNTNNSSLCMAYIEGLKRLLYDTGISVRKTVVSVFRDILISQPYHPMYSELCLVLLEKASQVREEESIKEVIRNMFQQLWFSVPLSFTGAGAAGSYFASAAEAKPSPGYASIIVPTTSTSTSSTSLSTAVSQSTNKNHLILSSSSSSSASTSDETDVSIKQQDGTVVEDPSTINTSGTVALVGSPTTPSSALGAGAAAVAVSQKHHNQQQKQQQQQQHTAEEAQSLHIHSTALQLVSIANLPYAQEWIISLVEEVLHSSPHDGDQVKAVTRTKRGESLLHCQKMVACFVEMLLRTEEREPLLLAYLEDKGIDVATHIVSIVTTLSLFATAHPPLVVPHVKTLLPYLKGDSSFTAAQNAAICLRMTTILSSVAVLEDFNVSFDVADVLNDLTNIALNSNNSNITAAVQCMATLVAHITNDAQPLFQLADRLFKAMMAVLRSLQESEYVSHHRRHPPPLHYYQLSMAQSAKLQRCITVLGYVCEHGRKCRRQLHELGETYDNILRSAVAVPTTAMASTAASLSTASAAYISTETEAREWLQNLYLSCSGSSGRNINEAVAVLDIRDVSFLHPGAIAGMCYSAISFVLQNVQCLSDRVHLPVHLRCVQALCGVYAGCPRIMLLANSTELITQVLSSSSSSSPSSSSSSAEGQEQEEKQQQPHQQSFNEVVHERFIMSLKDMMSAEEALLEKKQSLKLMNESGVGLKSSVIRDTVLGGGAADVENDATVAGFVLQQHLPTLSAFVSHTSETLRLAALQLMGTLLRQGMVCPLDVMGQLVALQGDVVSEIRQYALMLLQTEDRRHASFLDNRLAEGVERAVGFQLAILGRVVPTENGIATLAMQREQDDAFLQADGTENTAAVSDAINSINNSNILSIFSPLYRTSIRSNKRRNLEFLFGLLRRGNFLLSQITADVDINASSSSASSSSSSTSSSSNSTTGASSVAGASLSAKKAARLLLTAGGKGRAGSSKTSNSSNNNSSSSSNLTSPSDTSTAHLLSKQSGLHTKVTAALRTELKEALHKVHIVEFFAATLAHLPYSNTDDPLYVIYWVNRNLPLPTGHVLSKLKIALLRLSSSCCTTSLTASSAAAAIGVGAFKEPLSAMAPPALRGLAAALAEPFVSSSSSSPSLAISNKNSQAAEEQSGGDFAEPKDKVSSLLPLTTTATIAATATTTNNNAIKTAAPVSPFLQFSAEGMLRWMYREIQMPNSANNSSSSSSNESVAAPKNDSNNSSSVIHTGVIHVLQRIREVLLLVLELRGRESTLRLKAFLKLAYNLSDERCSAFNPDDKNSHSSSSGNGSASGAGTGTGDASSSAATASSGNSNSTGNAVLGASMATTSALLNGDSATVDAADRCDACDTSLVYRPYPSVSTIRQHHPAMASLLPLSSSAAASAAGSTAVVGGGGGTVGASVKKGGRKLSAKAAATATAASSTAVSTVVPETTPVSCDVAYGALSGTSAAAAAAAEDADTYSNNNTNKNSSNSNALDGLLSTALQVLSTARRGGFNLGKEDADDEEEKKRKGEKQKEDMWLAHVTSTGLLNDLLSAVRYAVCDFNRMVHALHTESDGFAVSRNGGYGFGNGSAVNKRRRAGGASSASSSSSSISGAKRGRKPKAAAAVGNGSNGVSSNKRSAAMKNKKKKKQNSKKSKYSLSDDSGDDDDEDDQWDDSTLGDGDDGDDNGVDDDDDDYFNEATSAGAGAAAERRRRFTASDDDDMISMKSDSSTSSRSTRSSSRRHTSSDTKKMKNSMSAGGHANSPSKKVHSVNGLAALMVNNSPTKTSN